MSFIGKRIKAFAYAFNGIGQAIKKEDSIKVHLLATILVLAAGWYFGITKVEWIIICICIGIVLSAELFNTAIEKLCDLYSPDKNEKIKYIKDVSAGAVLIVVAAAVIVALIVFLPYLRQMT